MADYKYVTENGVIVPDTADILAEVEQEWKDVFGEDLDVNPETPEGILIAAEVAARSEMVANNAAVANQINPNIAGGIFLDDIWALTGGQRRTATYTVIYNVALGGIPGVVIPSGSRRATAAGDIFELISVVQLDETGSGAGTFQALESGAVPAPANSLTVPVAGYTSVGWETSNNPDAGQVGNSEQSDTSARRERRNTLALIGRSIAESMYSNVQALDSVESLSFRENYEDTQQTIEGIVMKPHSVWACVDGGTDEQVAAALYRSKTAGAGWNGAVAVQVTDPVSGQKSTVLFDRPTAVPIVVRVTVSAGSSVADPASAVRAGIVAYAAGTTDEEGFKLGTDISPFELAAAVNAYAPGLFISKVEVSRKVNPPAWTTATIEMGLNEKATILAADVTTVTL